LSKEQKAGKPRAVSHPRAACVKRAGHGRAAREVVASALLNAVVWRDS
jgi:hypothetical protein